MEEIDMERINLLNSIKDQIINAEDRNLKRINDKISENKMVEQIIKIVEKEIRWY